MLPKFSFFFKNGPKILPKDERIEVIFAFSVTILWGFSQMYAYFYTFSIQDIEETSRASTTIKLLKSSIWMLIFYSIPLE